MLYKTVVLGKTFFIKTNRPLQNKAALLRSLQHLTFEVASPDTPCDYDTYEEFRESALLYMAGKCRKSFVTRCVVGFFLAFVLYGFAAALVNHYNEAGWGWYIIATVGYLSGCYFYFKETHKTLLKARGYEMEALRLK